MWAPVPAPVCCYRATVGLTGTGVGQRGAGDAAGAEGCGLSPTAERQPRTPHVAAVGPGSCELGWPQDASPQERVSLTTDRVVLGVTTHDKHQPRPTTQGTQNSPVPTLPTGFTLQPGTSQPSPLVPASPRPRSRRSGPSVTQKFSENTGGTRSWWSPGRCDGFSRALVPAGDLWNKITAGSMH